MLFMEVLWHPFGANFGMENKSLRSIYWICWLYRQWSRKQQEIVDKKSKSSKSTAAERWKTGAEDWIFILGEWRMPLLHLWRRRSGILHSPRKNLPLRQTTNRASSHAHSQRIKADSEVVWLPLLFICICVCVFAYAIWSLFLLYFKIFKDQRGHCKMCKTKHEFIWTTYVNTITLKVNKVLENNLIRQLALPLWFYQIMIF